MRRARSLLFFALSLAACGARSELIAPRLDASTDALLVDAASDAPARCGSDRDCDDNIDCTTDRCVIGTGRCTHTGDDRRCDDALFCTGVERCVVDRGCVTTPVQCADAVNCTNDRCDEARRQCVHAPDDSLCPISHRCDETEGCLARAFAHGSTGLYEVLLPAARVRTIAPVRVSLTDIALHPDRTLYGIGAAGLYRVDPDTGAAESVVALPLPFASLDATQDGQLFAAAGNTLYRIDVAAGGAVPVAEFPPGLESSGDLAVLEGRLLATARTDMTTTDDTLVELHTDRSAPARVIGHVGTGCVWGLAAFGPTLYGFSCMGQVLRIDPNTGRGTTLALSSFRFYGATAR
ncbi:MAG: hypothetical protein U0269_32805 [Polyangiales bacterium]